MPIRRLEKQVIKYFVCSVTYFSLHTENTSDRCCIGMLVAGVSSGWTLFSWKESNRQYTWPPRARLFHTGHDFPLMSENGQGAGGGARAGERGAVVMLLLYICAAFCCM